MTTQFGILSAFDHNVQSWKVYKNRIAQWFIANSIDSKTDADGTRRRAILLSVLTEDTYKLATDLALPKILESVPYEDILSILDTHFTPKRCGFSDRHQFYSASQQSGETYAQWAARLRGLAAHCDFADVTEALRDRFVMGMLPGPEKEKLFSQNLKELTLTKAVDLAASIQCARAGAAASTSAPHSSSLSNVQLFKITNMSDKKSVEKCKVCGRNNHKSDECRFAKYTCKKCKKQGHLQKMCKKVNYILEDDVSDGDDVGKFFNIRSVGGEPMVECVTMGGQLLSLEIDSGSDVTIIPKNTCKEHFESVPLLSTGKRLITYTGHKILCEGILRVPVTYSGRTTCSGQQWTSFIRS